MRCDFFIGSVPERLRARLLETSNSRLGNDIISKSKDQATSRVLISSLVAQPDLRRAARRDGHWEAFEARVTAHWWVSRLTCETNDSVPGVALCPILSGFAALSLFDFRNQFSG